MEKYFNEIKHNDQFILNQYYLLIKTLLNQRHQISINMAKIKRLETQISLLERVI
jgi:hypothetical protein